MSEQQYKRRRQIRDGRLEIVAREYRRGASYRRIQSEVLARLDQPSYSLTTVKRDIQFLLKEWRESELVDIHAAKTLELARIDDTIQELWDQWEKSKEDYSRKTKKRKGAPAKGHTGQDESTPGGIRTYSVEETETEVVNLGDVSYISEVRAQLQERRKILGLYAPEQSEVKVTEYDFDNLTEEQQAVLQALGEAALNDTES